MKTTIVTATEANRSFSKLLRDVQRGERVEITSHGRIVAVISAPEEAAEREERRAAYADLKCHWAAVTPKTVGAWTRDELNARD